MITSIHNLEQRLNCRYDVKSICDAGTMSDSPNGLFKLLHSVYQTTYQPNDRIVFYTSHLLSEEFLKHLYNTVNFINISNCFVLICGPAELEPAVKANCAKFSHDPISFDFLTVSLPATKKIENKFDLPATMCAIPWTNLEIKSNGNITPCCTSTDLQLGNIKSTTLERAFASNKLQELRNSLLAGDRPETCKQCWKVEENNLTSIRMHNIKRLKTELLLNYLDKPQLATIDIKFNNTCNFKCRICGPGPSSLFAAEDHKFRGVALVTQNNWSESEEFIDQITSHLPTIHNIDMYGGEPFLIKKFAKVLKLAVDRGNASNIRLHYNSNGSVWPNQFLPYWPVFKLVDIHFSIDAVGSQFDLQRGGSWNKVEDNILRLKELRLPNLSISLMPTVSIMNVFYIDQVYDWANKHQFPIFVNHARGLGMELRYLTRPAKDLIIEKYKHHSWSEMQQIIKIIKELPDNNGQEFRNKIEYFDRVRKENFSESHPEIAKVMGYVYNTNL